MNNNDAVYIFIPMSYKDPDDIYVHLHKAILTGMTDETHYWKAMDRGYEAELKEYDYDRYLLRYIADRFHGRELVKEQSEENTENVYYYRGNHFQLNNADAVRDKFGLPRCEEKCVLTIDGPAKGNVFYLDAVQLFTFDTGVFILAFRLKMEDASVGAVSDTIFQLKNVSKENFCIEGKNNRCSLLELAQNIGTDIYDRAVTEKPEHRNLHFRYLYYQKEGYERANILTVLLLDDPRADGENTNLLNCDECRHDLFFLRNGFGTTFTDYEDRKKGEEEIYVHSNHAIWGVTQEAAACLIYPAGKKFYKKILPKNIHSYYLLMYVLLLHQKYALYLFLRNIGDKEHEVSTEDLRDYRNRLYRFETGYVFSHISEVPQYQGLYEKMYRNMRLGEMYQDVREPLVMLDQLETTDEQKEREKQNIRMTGAMFLLSLLVIISALTDGLDLVDTVLKMGTWGSGQWIGFAVIIVFVLGVIVAGICIIKNKSWKERKNSESRK